MGTLIEAAHLFRGEPPPSIDSTFWAWAQDTIESGRLAGNLLAALNDLEVAETEGQFLAALQDIRTEIEAIPIPD